MTLAEEYEQLLDLFFQLVQSQAGNSIESGNEWKNDAQTLSVKLFRHLASMRAIANGGRIVFPGGPPVPYIDHASIKVLARAALETYLVFYYLFGGDDEKLCRFRHATWVLGGLSDRQNSHASLEEHREKLKHEKRQIENLNLEISASPYLADYTARQQRRLLDGDWRVGKSWTDLGVSADFNRKYFENIYSYLCGYSHASYISALQVGQATKIEDQAKLTNSILGIGMVIMAHYVFSYSSVFQSAGGVLEQNAISKVIAEKWHFRSEDME